MILGRKKISREIVIRGSFAKYAAVSLNDYATLGNGHFDMLNLRYETLVFHQSVVF